jgi:lipoate-protein ligase A
VPIVFKSLSGLTPDLSGVWRLLRSPPGEPTGNMALDEALLDEVGAMGAPVLRFYGWSTPAATFGYFQRYAEVESMTRLRPLVRRPTGGGLVLHEMDWTYSLVFPSSHGWSHLPAVESYQILHDWIQAAFARLGVASELAPCSRKEQPGRCFAGAEKFDLLQAGRKIAGAAQRRTRGGMLIQGSIQPPASGPRRADWENALCEVAREKWMVEWKPLNPAASLYVRARLLAEEKYSQPAHNRRR